MEPIRFYSAFLIFLMAITLAAPTSHAQSSSLSGRVTDESGAVFPGAEITVTNDGQRSPANHTVQQWGTVHFCPAPTRLLYAGGDPAGLPIGDY